MERAPSHVHFPVSDRPENKTPKETINDIHQELESHLRESPEDGTTMVFTDLKGCAGFPPVILLHHVTLHSPGNH